MNFKSKKQLVIGLTGGMLSGKSTALKIFERCGAYVLCCDELVREISARPSVQKQIEKLLGKSDKAFLVQKVFSNVQARKKLENLLHPLVLKEMKKRLKADKTCLQVVEVPLLFEAGWEDYFDCTMAILASEKNLQKRLAARSVKKEDFLKRTSAQFPAEKKAALADICVLNAADVACLAKKVQAIYHAFTKIYQVK